MAVHITEKAKNKLDLYIQLADGEISGLCRIKVEEEKIIVTDLFILKQEATGSTTDLDEQALTDFLTNETHPEEIRGWWHSHAHMGVFFSSTDEETMASFGGDWLIGIVGNKDGEYKARINAFAPVHLYLDTTLVEEKEIDQTAKEAIEVEIKELVSAPVTAVTVIDGKQDQFGFGRDNYSGYEVGMVWDSVKQIWRKKTKEEKKKERKARNKRWGNKKLTEEEFADEWSDWVQDEKGDWFHKDTMIGKDIIERQESRKVTDIPL